MKKLTVRISVLILLLMLIVSGVWAYFLRDLLLQAGFPQAKIYSSILSVGIFIFILILDFWVVAILLELIFSEGIKSGFLEFIRQVAGLKDAPMGSHVDLNEEDELGDLAKQVNEVIDKLENEINKDLKTAAEEHMHFVEEQSKVGFESKKIYEEKEKLQYVLTRIKDGVILLSKNRKVVLMNAAAEELTGFKVYEASGKPVNTVLRFFEEDREIKPDEYAPVTQTAAAKDEVYQKKHLKIESQQATEKYVDLVCMKLTLIQTQDLGYMIIMHDLTARLEIEKKRTELLKAFANDLKGPLNIISNNLQNDPGSVQSGTAYLSLIFENLMAAGAIEDGSIYVNMGQVDLAESVQNVVMMVQPIATGRQIALQFAGPKDFSAVVNGDQSRIFQIVLNLLLNAIYFTGSGGSVSISFSSPEDDVVLEIQDTGIGIPTEAMEGLFQKFGVVQNDKGIETGIGLGLYVSKKLIDLQNGKIWLDSVEGRGTVASISLQKVKS